jgi:hypothetical protein
VGTAWPAGIEWVSVGELKCSCGAPGEIFCEPPLAGAEIDGGGGRRDETGMRDDRAVTSQLGAYRGGVVIDRSRLPALVPGDVVIWQPATDLSARVAGECAQRRCDRRRALRRHLY